VSWRLARELLFVIVAVVALEVSSGSYGRSGDVGVVMGVGISADVTDMTAPSRPHAGSAGLHAAGIEASWLRAAVSPAHARVRAKVLLTRWAQRRRWRVRHVPFKTVRRALVRDFAFRLLPFSLVLAP
jgi:hypothetical protein